MNDIGTVIPNIDKIFPQVQSALEEYFSSNLKEKLQSLEQLQKFERPYSTVVILRVKSDYNYYRLVMKTMIHHPINKIFFEKENQAVVEYNILKILYSRYQYIEDCNVPEPLLVLPDIETYVMRFVEGTLMMDNFCYTRMFSSLKYFELLRNNMCLYGKWLKLFQDFTFKERVDGSIAYDPVIERAKHRLKLIEDNYKNVIPNNFRATVDYFFHEQLAIVERQKIQVYGRHGDFTPLNAIMGPDGITVIDFLGFDYEPPEVDILKVLIFLENESMSVTSSKSRVKSLKQAFLNGYGDLNGIPESGQLICEAMQRIVSIWGHCSTPKRLLHHRFESYLIIKRHLSWFSNPYRILGNYFSL